MALSRPPTQASTPSTPELLDTLIRSMAPDEAARADSPTGRASGAWTVQHEARSCTTPQLGPDIRRRAFAFPTDEGDDDDICRRSTRLGLDGHWGGFFSGGTPPRRVSTPRSGRPVVLARMRPGRPATEDPEDDASSHVEGRDMATW